MTRFSELIEVHLKETEAVIAQSALLLQKKESGQSGELKSAGNLVEKYIRNFINRISPDGLKVTSGYIVSPETLKAKENLSQHDIILASKATPPIFSIIDDEIEIIPVESMVGIIEIKRKLTSKSLEDAQSQIVNTYENTIKNYRNKNENYSTVSISSLKPGTQTPLFGIIGLTSELSRSDIDSIIDPNIIDFVWAFKHNEAFVIGDSQGKTTGTVSRKDVDSPRMLTIKGTEAVVFSKVKGILSFWLSSLASQWIKADAITGYYIDIWDQNDL